MPARRPDLGAERFDGNCVDVELARGSALAANDLVHLRHASHEFAEQLLVHGRASTLHVIEMNPVLLQAHSSPAPARH